MAAVTDRFNEATNGTRPVPTTLTALKSIGAPTITCNALSGWPTATAVHFIIYTVDSSGNKVAGSQTDWKGVVSSNTITNLTLKAGTDNGYAIGAIVECAPTAAWASDIADGLRVEHNQDGTHAAMTTPQITATNGIFTNLTVAGQAQSGGWTPLGQNVTYGTNNGNKEFTVTAPTDLTGTLSPGMKVRLARGTTPPTQSMSFTAASSQYATKASATGITFTGDFSVEAWIKPVGWTGAAQEILVRENGTNAGFGLRLEAYGSIAGFYANAGGYTNNHTYEAPPLNEWTHIAVTFSVASKTITTYFNGFPVGNIQVSAGANAVVQATTALGVGYNSNGVSNFFNGQISEIRLWTTAISQAQIQANMAINLVGNEANLIALYPGNGNFNDATTNANNLTATNGAISTFAANPYNTLEHGVIVAASYSNPNTTLTIFTGAAGNIPNQTLTSPSYSLVETPFGIPGGLENNRAIRVINGQISTTTTSTTDVQVPGFSATVTVPVGRRVRIKHHQPVQYNSSANVGNNISIWDGAVGTGTKLAQAAIYMPAASTANPIHLERTFSVTPGLHTFTGSFSTSAGSAFTNGSQVQPTQFIVELV